MTNANIKYPRFAKKPTKLSKPLEDFMRFWAYPDKPNHTYPKCVFKFLISFDIYTENLNKVHPLPLDILLMYKSCNLIGW